MRLSPEQRSALLIIGNAAIGLALGISVLVVAFILSQFVAGQGRIPATTASTASALISTVAAMTPTAPPTTPIPPTATPTATPTDTPTAPPASATPTSIPSPTPDPMTVEAYRNSGRRYAALSAPVDYVYLAPVAGTVRVQLYQFIAGEVRVGSNVPSLPFFPYVTLQSADRRIIFRPGALNADTEMLIQDGERAEPGTPLFKTIGEGPSSWRTFYDRNVAANVIVSVVALPSGVELDPVAFFMAR